MPYVVKAVAGPDRVVPNKTLVGFDGTRSTPQGLGGLDLIQYQWEMIQVPEGDPYLKHFTNAYVMPMSERVLAPVLGPARMDATMGSSSLVFYDSTLPVPNPIDLTVAGVVTGDVIIVTAGPNAGRYVIQNDPHGAFLNEVDVDVPMPATSIADYPDFKIWDPDSFLIQFSFAFGEINSGDVINIDGIPDRINGAFPGFGVSVDDPLPLAGMTFPHVVVIGGNILTNATMAYPSFVPSVQGLYVLRLHVKTASMFNWADPPDVLAVSVLPSTSALSLPVDASWIWKALSDFWTNVSDKGWMEDMWRTVIRVYGAMLQETWNVELAASLGTSQDVAMSRWMAVEPRLDEPEPEKVGFFKRFRRIYSNADVLAPITATISVYNASDPFYFSYSGSFLGFPAAFNAAIEAEGIEGVSSHIETITTTLGGVKNHIVIESDNYYITAAGDPMTGFPFSLTFPSNTFNGSGRVIDEHTFALAPAAPTSSSYANSCYDYDGVLKAGDPINIGGTNHTITAVGISNENEYQYTRVTVDETINLAVTSVTVFCAPAYFKSPTVDYRWEMVTPGDFALLTIMDGETRKDLSALVYATSPYCLGIDHPALYFDDRTIQVEGVLRVSYVPVDDIWMSAPQLKEAPDATKGWLEYNEYVIATRWGRRVVAFNFLNETVDDNYYTLCRYPMYMAGVPVYPSNRLWAEVVYLDQRPDLSERFGKGMSFPLENSPVRPGYSYQRALLGLWYCYLHGSKPRFIERGLSIVLGAPFFEEDGMILDIQKLDTERGYLLVADKDSPEVVRGYIYRFSLGLDENPLTGQVYKIGDAVKQFETVTNSAVYRDYINDPDFIRAMIVAGFITEPEKIHHFFIGADVDALDPTDTQALQAAADFLEMFHTTYNEPFFTLIKRLEEEIHIEDEMSIKYTLVLDGYFGARWGFPRIDRPQLSGIQSDWHTGLGVGVGPSTDHGFHNRVGHTIDSQEHYTAVIVGGGAGLPRVIEIRHVQKNGTHGSAINPRLYGVKPGDLFVEPTMGGSVTDAIAQVGETSIVLTNPYWGSIWPAVDTDLFAFSVYGRYIWWGLDDSKMQPRSYVRIRVGTGFTYPRNIPGEAVVETEKVLVAPALAPTRVTFTAGQYTATFDDQLGNLIDLAVGPPIVVVGDLIEVYAPAANAGLFIVKEIVGLGVARIGRLPVSTETIDYAGYKIFDRTDKVVADHPGPELDTTNPNWPEDWPWTPWP